MTDVKADVEYKINLDGKSFLLDRKKYSLLLNILESNSLTAASKQVGVSYKTALNYISRIEEALDVKIVDTTKGGSGGGGSATLTDEALSIVMECKKINAILELHNNVNEIEMGVVAVDEVKGIMTIKKDDFKVKAPLNRKYAIGDELLALISYDNIVLMLEPQTSSIRNLFKGTIVEMKLEGEIIRVKTDIGGVFLFSDITVSAEKELNLSIGSKIYLGFKAISVATLKL